MPKHWLDQRLEELKPQGKSKSGLARALGLPSSRVSEIISGVRAIKAKELRPMADYLEWPMDALAANINTGKPSPGAAVAGKEQVMTGDDPGVAQEDRQMKRELEEIRQIYQRLGAEDRTDVLRYMRDKDRVRAAREAAEAGPTAAVAG
jgi:hypothetical protein